MSDVSKQKPSIAVKPVVAPTYDGAMPRKVVGVATRFSEAPSRFGVAAKWQAKGSAKPEVKAATPKSDTIPPSTITTSSSSSSLTDVTRDDVIMMCAPPAKVMPERSTAQQSRVVPEMTSVPVDGCKQEEGGDDIRRKFAVTRLTGALSRMVARPPSTAEAPVKSPSFSALSDKKRAAIEADPKTFQFKDL